MDKKDIDKISRLFSFFGTDECEPSTEEIISVLNLIKPCINLPATLSAIPYSALYKGSHCDSAIFPYDIGKPLDKCWFPSHKDTEFRCILLWNLGDSFAVLFCPYGGNEPNDVVVVGKEFITLPVCVS